MTKKQILASFLASSLALGCISGCGAKKSERTILAQVDEIKEGYYINIIMASPVYNAEGQIEYYIAPDGFIVKGNLAYQVNHRTIVKPIVQVTKNGTVSYSLPNGGTLSNDGVNVVGYQDRTVTDENVIEEILEEYLENKDANRKTLK